jgi:hypothetical protein
MAAGYAPAPDAHYARPAMKSAKAATPRRPSSRLVRWVVVLGLLVLVPWLVLRWLIRPGSGYTGPLPALTPAEQALAETLRADVVRLAIGIGERNLARAPAGLAAAAQHIEDALRAAGYAVSRQSFEVDGQRCDNVVGEWTGSAEIVVVGAHYDSVSQCPGANDNGSGVAALLALARALAGARPARTLRFVGFVNEEPPHFQKDTMGSLVYARACFTKQEQVVAMLTDTALFRYRQ